MSSNSRARAGGRAQRAGCTGTFAPAAPRAAASEQAALASSYISPQSRRAAELMLTASMYNSTTPTAPIWSEKRSQAQRADGKSFAKPGPQWAKLSRARGSQRPDLSPACPQRRRSSAPGAIKAPRTKNQPTGTKPARTQPPAAQRPALLQEHCLRTPAARTGPAAEAVILCSQSLWAICKNAGDAALYLSPQPLRNTKICNASRAARRKL